MCVCVCVCVCVCACVCVRACVVNSKYASSSGGQNQRAMYVCVGLCVG